MFYVQAVVGEVDARRLVLPDELVQALGSDAFNGVFSQIAEGEVAARSHQLVQREGDDGLPPFGDVGQPLGEVHRMAEQVPFLANGRSSGGRPSVLMPSVIVTLNIAAGRW